MEQRDADRLSARLRKPSFQCLNLALARYNILPRLSCEMRRALAHDLSSFLFVSFLSPPQLQIYIYPTTLLKKVSPHNIVMYHHPT
jgi:hypothetical protein